MLSSGCLKLSAELNDVDAFHVLKRKWLKSTTTSTNSSPLNKDFDLEPDMKSSKIKTLCYDPKTSLESTTFVDFHAN